MRTSLAICCTVLALATPAFGQSPTPASTSLTKEERDRAVAYLTETQKDFLAAIDGLTEEQWKFKAAPDRWSIAETAEHIAVAEGTVWTVVRDKIMKSPAAPERRDEVKGKDERILEVIPDRSTKVQAPEILQPTGRWQTQAALAKEFTATRGATIEYLRTTNDDLRSHFGEHPFLKTLDAYQWLVLNGAHTKRHTGQILEVKADPNFPKG
jgi:hypothetical protein